MEQESELRTVANWKAHQMSGDRKGTWSLFVRRPEMPGSSPGKTAFK